MTGTAALAAATARRYPPIASTVHPSSSAARNGAVSHATFTGNRARALVCQALVPVSAGNEEHGGSIGDGSNNGTASNNGTGRVHLAAGSNVTSHGAAIAVSTSRSSSAGGGSCVCGSTTTAAREVTSSKRTRCVDLASKIVDSLVWVVPEVISRVAELSSKLGLEIQRNGEQSQRGDETLVLHCVQRLQSQVVHLGDGDVQTVSDSLGKVVKDLLSTIVC